MSADKIFKVGDLVWLAKCGTQEVTKTCPICFGKLTVSLTLGNGDTLELPCDYCGKGLAGPTGFVTEYEFVSNPECVEISSVILTNENGLETREYRSNHWNLEVEDIFTSKEDATKRCEQKAAALSLEQATRAEYIKKDECKSYSWNAGYHLRCATSAARDLAYHQNMAAICKARSKDGEK